MSRSPRDFRVSFVRARTAGVGARLVLFALLAFAAGCGSGSDGGTATPPAPPPPPPDPGTPAASVDSIFLALDSATLVIGDTVQLVAVPKNSSGQAVTGVALVWTSTDHSVATVSATGLVTAVGFGEAEIDVDVINATLRAGDGSAHLRQPPSRRSRLKFKSVPTIIITPGSSSVEVGDHVNYSARLVDKFNNQLSHYPVIIWSSSAPAVATIDQSGKATAISTGTTNIGAGVSFASGTGALPVHVPLQVALCGGILDLNSWTATLATSYAVVNKVIFTNSGAQELTFNVAQSSQGTATLHRLTRDTVDHFSTWEGVVAGTGSVNNRVNQRDLIQGNWVSSPPASDTRSGPLSSLYAIVRLRVQWTGAAGCKYTLTFEDGAGYKHLDGDGGTFTVDVSAAVTQFEGPAGAKPAGGWRLTGAPDQPAMLVDLTTATTDELGLNLAANFYSPLPPVPESMLFLITNGMFGTGKFTYTLVGQ